MQQIDHDLWVTKIMIEPEPKIKNKPLLYLIMAIAMVQLGIMLSLGYYYLF